MLPKEKLSELLFPHDEVRDIQNQLVEAIDQCIANKKNLIVHAPTGLGKTAASLPVALSHALKNKLTVFFLTSRQTQHTIAINTLKQIKKKYGTEFAALDIIGKKAMCPVPGVQELYSNEFYEFCKSQKEESKCEFYTNTRKKSGSPQIKAEKIVDKLKKMSPFHCEEMMKLCADEKLCPYEIAQILAKSSHVVIADYYYIFHPDIRNTFFSKSDKELGRTIVIVDEAHNLPGRTRELLTSRLSDQTIKRAISEAQKFGKEESLGYLKGLKEIFDGYHAKLKAVEKAQNSVINEILVLKEDFVNKVNAFGKYDEIITNLEFTGEEILEKKKRSYIAGISSFLEAWLGQDESFTRILARRYRDKGTVITISYRCLDPSLATKEAVNNSHSTIVMSGTLTPTSMYKDLLGFDAAKTVEKEFPSPFPVENRLSIIVPETTTKFTERSPEQFKQIAKITSDIVNMIPGNSAVFFPSYSMMTEINRYFSPLCRKTCFLEQSELGKNDKEDMLERFKQYKDSGAVLLGVASGSFSQGIDFAGNILKAVIIVGLPLQVPDLETRELIDYYEKKFKHGWDYGYVFPAITKCVQSAGRCIRSETDRGVIIFLDKRFAWSNYRKCFPPEWNMNVTSLYQEKVKKFFETN